MVFRGQNKQLFCNEKRIADPDGNFDHLQGFLSYCMWICRFRSKFVTVYSIYNICKLASGPKAF